MVILVFDSFLDTFVPYNNHITSYSVDAGVIIELSRKKTVRSFTALLQKEQKHADGSAVYPPEMGRATAFLSWIEEEFAVGMEPLQELLEAMKQHNEIQNLKELTIVALHTDRP